MSTTDPDESGTDWPSPGPGTWRSELDHVPNAVTAGYRDVYAEPRTTAFAAMFERYGVPAAGMGVGWVHGRQYLRLIPLVGARSSAPPPPRPVLWLTTRVHPRFRRRRRAAQATFADRRWRADATRWSTEVRPRMEAANLAIQDEDPGALDDAGLADHLDRVRAHVREAVAVHFDMKGVDTLPVGDLLAACVAWGVPAPAAAALLGGASPASAAPPAMAELRAATAAALAGGAAVPTTLDQLRDLGPAVADALDAYLRLAGWRVVGGYDLTSLTLHEQPRLVLGAALAAPTEPARPPGDDAVAAIRALVPAAERADFDTRLAEARDCYGLRDENSPLTMQWPMGLLRRALLEAGRRLAATGQLHDAAHAIDLTAPEAAALVRGRPGPSADEAAARAAERARGDQLTPPQRIGPDDAIDPSALPAALARMVRAVEACLAMMGTSPTARAALDGTGIGERTYCGRAVVASDAADALDRLADGDVLVTTTTTPAFNVVLSFAGAVVTSEGGPLCHTALIARELGLPAVVGARDATRAIPDGAWVEVDPVAGRVRLLKTGAEEPTPAMA